MSLLKWGVQDSNLRRLSQQIYSLSRLTASVTPRTLELQLFTETCNLKNRHAKYEKKASGGVRTHDLRFTKPLLCQLSYAGVFFSKVVEVR